MVGGIGGRWKVVERRQPVRRSRQGTWSYHYSIIHIQNPCSPVHSLLTNPHSLPLEESPPMRVGAIAQTVVPLPPYPWSLADVRTVPYAKVL